MRPAHTVNCLSCDRTIVTGAEPHEEVECPDCGCCFPVSEMQDYHDKITEEPATVADFINLI